MKVITTRLSGVCLIEPDVFEDERGLFMETYNRARYEEFGIPGKGLEFVQDNHSMSKFGVLRGLHFQLRHPQGKLVSVSHGKVFDVVVDICRTSPTYLQWLGWELSAENHRQLYIPPGYAHGFCVLSETADFHYKCTEYYMPGDEGGVIWNDPELKIDWPVKEPIVSEKDMSLPTLSQLSDSKLPRP